MSFDTNQEDLMERGEVGADYIIEPEALPEIQITESAASIYLDKVERITQCSVDIGTVEPTSEGKKFPGSEWVARNLRRNKVSPRWRKKTEELSEEELERHKEYAKVTVRKLEECPHGYPRLSAFLTSDDDLMLYRRFSYIQSRLLLYKQDELRQLETKLDRMDAQDLIDQPRILKSRERDDIRVGKRKHLLSDIEVKFTEYANLLIKARDLTSFHNPRSRDYQSVLDYFKGKDPVAEVERYILHREDILTLKTGRDESWLDGVLDRMLNRFNGPFIRYLFSSSELAKKADPRTSGVILFNQEKIDNFKTLLILVMIIVHFAGPVYLLWWMTRQPQTNTSTAGEVGVLLAFTCTFCIVLSQFTSVQRHELLASAAAYCAVLVVFISNAGNSPSPSAPNVKPSANT